MVAIKVIKIDSPNYGSLSLCNILLRHRTNILTNGTKMDLLVFKDKLTGLWVYLWFLTQNFLAENGFNDYLL